MIRDLDILRLMSSRDMVDKYKSVVKLDTIEQHARTVLEAMYDYYEENKDKLTVEPDTFGTYFLVMKHPDLKGDERKLYEMIIKKLNVEVSEFGDDIIKHYNKQLLNMELKGLMEADAPTSEYLAAIDSYNAVQSDTEDPLAGCISDEIDDLLGKFDKTQGLHWRMQSLDKLLGPLAVGDFGIIAARPDGGKTSFLACEVTHMARQLGDDEVILWLNTENAGEKIKQRLYSAFFNLPFRDVVDKKASAQDKFTRYGGAKVKVMDIQHKSIFQVEELISKVKPRLVILDMADALLGYEKTKDRFESLYQHILTLASSRCPVLATSQVSRNPIFPKAEGFKDRCKYPTLDDLHWSKTSKQGAASFILMIGGLTEHQSAKYLSAPKNKFGAGYFRLPVVFNPTTSRYEERRR